MADPDFESDLFHRFGEPATQWDDNGVTQRILRRVEAQGRSRRLALAGAAIASASLFVAAAMALAGPLLAGLGDRFGVDPGIAWMIGLATATLLAAVATRLALED
jgi:hypothetical protein